MLSKVFIQAITLALTCNINAANAANFLCEGISSVGFQFDQPSGGWQHTFFRPGEYALKQMTNENKYLNYTYVLHLETAHITPGFTLYAFEDLSNHKFLAACSEHMVNLFGDRSTNIVSCPPELQSADFIGKIREILITHLTFSADKTRFEFYDEGGYTVERGTGNQMNTDTPVLEIGSCNEF